MFIHESQLKFRFCAVLVAVGAWIICSCGGLPDDFDSLSLEGKILAYEKHVRRAGRGIEWARANIAWHGWEAADIMAEYLKGQRNGLPPYEAISIIHEVQSRGCSLQGTAAEIALKEYLKTTQPLSPERVAAVLALEGIRKNLTSDPESYTLKGGPCEPGATSQEQDSAGSRE